MTSLQLREDARFTVPGESVAFPSDPQRGRGRERVDKRDQNGKVQILHEGPLVIEQTAFKRPDTIMFGLMNHPKLCMIRPIKLDISVNEDVIIAHSDELQEYGQGRNISESVEDFGHTIRELFISLESNSDRLGQDLQRIWTSLQSYIARRSPA